MSIFGFVGDLLGIDDGSEVSQQIAETGAQVAPIFQETVDYARSAVDPRLQREQGAADLLYGFYSGDPNAQKQIYQSAQMSPYYSTLQDVGRQGVGASLSATGGLRTGAGPEAFYQQDQMILQNLVNQNLDGLGYFAQPTDITPVTYANRDYANTLADIGTAQAQAQQTGQGQQLGFFGGLAGSLIGSDGVF